jgi:aspartyl-tRNA(Asn)/glutamyl-tRNA(Gln) amidotransferase subunit A
MSTAGSSADLAGLDAGAMVRGYEGGTFSPVDVLDAAAGRIERLDPQLNAFVARSESARQAAEASAVRYRDGRPLSPLDGVPVAIKDNLVVAGMPATWGSRVFAGTICAGDELAVARLRAAGAVIIGKTNTPEFAVEGFTGNALFGVTGNPWDPSLTPGGSSGGSVAAVSARMVPVALGTDGGGSIRRPAAYTGLVGLKPTIGRIARHGGLPQVLLDFEVVGPLARTTADLATAYAIMAGSDVRDPTSRAVPLPRRRSAVRDRLRVLYVESFGDAPCDPEIRRSTRALADTIADLGHDVRAGPLPLDIERLNAIWPTIGAIGLARLVVDIPAMKSLASQKYLEMAEKADAIGAVHLASIIEQVGFLRGQASAWFGDNDIILTPSCAAMPWAAGDSHPETIDDQAVGPRGHAIYTGWVNAIGHPAIALPSEPHVDGMPIGAQLVGDLGSEEMLLDLAGCVERLRPWAHRMPDIVRRDEAVRGAR